MVRIMTFGNMTFDCTPYEQHVETIRILKLSKVDFRCLGGHEFAAPAGYTGPCPQMINGKECKFNPAPKATPKAKKP
jgi:hypothetical protein